MGRAIRRVPPNWDHPKLDGWPDGRLQPMYDHCFEAAVAEWKRGFLEWEAGEKFAAANLQDDGTTSEFWEYYGSPPDREYYRPWKDQEATWFQLWETVSAGTPVSPPFATKEELAEYLAEHGDHWDQKRGHGGWGAERARAFRESGYAPSLVVVNGQVFDGTDVPAIKQASGDSEHN